MGKFIRQIWVKDFFCDCSGWTWETVVSATARALRKLAHAIYRDFLSCKKGKISLENFHIFLIFAQNIDCGYTLELRQF